MSSSRDHCSLTGVPGIFCAIQTACLTYSWCTPRRPKPPPACILCTITFSSGMPAASDAEAMLDSPFWVPTQTSTLSSVTIAAAVCGSMVA